LADCFVSSPSQNIFVSSLFSPVKRRNSLCSGKHGKWNITCIVFYSHECLCEILHLRSTVGCQMSTFYCGGVGVQKYFLHAQMSTPCVECAITEIYLLLVARNLLYFKRFLATTNKFCSYLFFYFFGVLRHIVIVVASLSLVAFIVLDYMSNTASVL
jgi:hypothetical protein